ncbi:hypothetical protein [Demetria terragena]|uniref:hypothetical protein n=1 Tax=Demetria terragena TaxID=63959 RepID=UPI000475CD7C|nr:hypothetical protein [Demetria terragena]
MDTPLARRTFLASVGVLGALTATSTSAPTAQALANAQQAQSAGLVLDLVKKLLAEIGRDVYKGLAVFVVPGEDAYSRAQGTESTGPGGLDTRTPDFLIESLDNYVPLPDQLATPLAQALATGLGDIGIKIPGLPNLPLIDLSSLDKVLKWLLRNDETIPLSTLIALLLNTQAVRVDPSSAVGVFQSPFSRLSFEKKAQVFELLEGPDSNLVKMIDSKLPEPVRGSVSGLLQFVSGALLEFSAFGTFSEWTTFDADKLGVTSRPVGWDLAKYDAGSVDGWNELKGYYQDRKKVSDR